LKTNSIGECVGQIISAVRRRGDKALLEFTRRFDRVTLKEGFRVPLSKARQALKTLDPSLRDALMESARRIRRFHYEERRRQTKSWRLSDGQTVLGQEIGPVESVGIYVPGGRFSYPSTVLMTAIPARLAGVKRVVIATPPRRLEDGVLAAAMIAGVDETYQIGGPAAIAALAFGTRQVRRVDMIVGPGNALVTEAKRQVFGTVGIDSLAGPSELAIIADSGANAASLALDLEAQAEHDPEARSLLISLDRGLLDKVRRNVAPSLRPRCRFIFARSLPEAVHRVNEYAPEHLEICVRRPERILKKIRHAGAVFIGPWSPAVTGDYWAGSSHVLPTGRAARFSSGLSVMTFMKRTSIIQLSPRAFSRAARTCQRIAQAEGLSYHERSIDIRNLTQLRRSS
jgi:histidinol dehydrogenase